MKTRKFIILLLLAILTTGVYAQRPKLAVNIVIGGLRADDLQRYDKNFTTDGFRRMLSGGAVFTECYLDYVPSSSTVSLASIATGTTPSSHGISANKWYDRTSGNTEIALCHKKAATASNVPVSGIGTIYTTEHFTAQTLTDAVCSFRNDAHCITIAHESLSAMMLAGKSGECYWLDEKGGWASADCYTSSLPSWVALHNSLTYNKVFVLGAWFGKFTQSQYINSRRSDIKLYDFSSKQKTVTNAIPADWVKELRTTPAGNAAIFEFAKKAINALLTEKQYQGECKMVNIYLDIPREIAQKYGTESIEYEDMLYRLDGSLGEFLAHILAQQKSHDEIVITLCADHGMSPSYISGTAEKERFNSRQAEVILNAFLSARHGQGKWVLGYASGSIYLNHDLIYERKLTVDAIRAEAATFAQQFRGVANAISATSLQNGVFTKGVQHLVQNSFNPRRSGDIIIWLTPERIEEQPNKVADSGSPYNYDRHVPLIIYGGGIPATRYNRRVCATQLTPTLASLLGVSRPNASDAEILNEIKHK